MVQYDHKEKAISYVSQAKELAKNIEDPRLNARINNQEGAVYYISGEYELALRRYLLAYEFAVQAEAVIEKEIALNGRGLVLMVEGEYELAKSIFEECLAINYSLNDSVRLAKNHFNLGILENESGDLKLSMNHLKAASDYLTNFPNKHLNLMVNNRTAKVYHEMGDLEKASEKYIMVLQDSLTLSNWEKTFALTGLAQLKFESESYNEALTLGKAAYGSAVSHGAHWDLEKITQLLSEIYKKRKEFEQAYHFLSLSKAYGDSLFNEEKSRQIARLQLKLTQAENENLKVESEKDQALLKQRNRLLIFLSLMVIFSGFAIYFFRKNVILKERFNVSLQKKNKAIEKQKHHIDQQNKSLLEMNLAKTKLLSIISHDLRSPINSIKQLLEMKGKGYFSVEDENEAYELLAVQIRNTEIMLNELLQWANRQMDGVKPNPSMVNLPQTVTEVLLGYSFQIKTKLLNTDHQIAQNIDIIIDKVQLKIIIQNLIGNAIKFTPEHGLIKIHYKMNENFVICHIEDSGVGIEGKYHEMINGKDYARIPSVRGTANEKGTGLGILLVKQFLDLNGGDLKMESREGEGTHFILYFKRIQP
ncbi:tetratricopeptide repeat-containing sensor histidine kinase [Cyclobacterium sp. 1_MG-2023]|uniref:tetratricopeptide repeat-containing sensor histidine kinase n=1 Tax=Cyclobacterium sp. 1_MG-2023 TaxID=3062681 RepID=UPI0026E3FF73|nr:tetratricopeptide repeat-containing sensor histidine kinase [Cyclobacterium sp. 1_MG-2023]MDO6438507.1 tetratricopeptide repeat-containing sensor histidine kinase [Cyclobacterium sp. 1_MG-2023]